MKKRVSNSEIELARKSSRVLFIISFLLLVLLFVGFSVLYYMDIDLISYGHDVPIERKTTSNKTPKKNSVIIVEDEKSDSIELDINDTNIQRFYNIVRITNKTVCEEYRYGLKNKILTGGLSSKCKFSLASQIYKDNLKTTLEGKLYVKEDDVRSAYETLFGTGTYTVQESIPCLYKTDFMYSGEYYFTEKVASEEKSSLKPYEKILSAVRDGEKLEITSAVIYHETNLSLLCKDYRCVNVIEKLKPGVEYGNEYLSLYVDHNKDTLSQFVYHFEMDKTGFYRYVGYDRKD